MLNYDFGQMYPAKQNPQKLIDGSRNKIYKTHVFSYEIVSPE
jgi:hypothetical protein